jgi:hypothetical protein
MAAGRDGGPPPGHKVYAGADILAFIRTAGMQPAQVARQALAAGLASEEVAALLSGAELAVDDRQEQALRAAVASSYAAGPGRGGGKGGGEAPVTDADGSTCGCSGNPSTPVPRQVAPVTGTRTGATEVNTGTTAHTGTVGGGTVTLRHDIHYRKTDGTDREHGFAVRYEGTDSQNAHWLQFIWREIVRRDASNNEAALTDSITTTGGSYQLTPGGTLTSSGTPGQNNYNTDNAPGAPDPFYENSGVANRTGDSTTIYDHPAAADAFVRREFSNGATAVKSRAHFLTFLVQTDRVTYKTSTNMEWSFAAATDRPAPVFSTGTNGAASNLAPDALRQRFHAQWPAFNYIT